MYFVGAPPSRLSDESGDRDVRRLNTLYAALGSPRFVRYVDAGAAVLDHGAWTSVLPCRSDEPCTGGAHATGKPVNVVRAVDGTYFCPAPSDAVRAVTGECSVWSSGAFRFGTAMADSVIGDVTQAAYLGPWLWKAAVEKAGSFDVDKVVAASPGIELTTAPEGYVKLHENHHLWSKTRIGEWQKDGQAKVVFESELIEPNPFPKGYQ